MPDSSLAELDWLLELLGPFLVLLCCSARSQAGLGTAAGALGVEQVLDCCRAGICNVGLFLEMKDGQMES